jgi:hypothetical protein
MPVPLTRLVRAGFLLIALSWNGLFAQAPRLDVLLKEHRNHLLGDTAYLNGVDSLAPLLLDDDSLPREFHPRQVPDALLSLPRPAGHH